MLIDTHCHLDFPDFTTELSDVLARAKAAGIARFVTISTRVRRIEAPMRIAVEHPEVYFTVGTHPHNAAEEPDVSVDDLVRLASHPKCVGIGEAGLDYHYDKSPRGVQAEGLRRHIAAARITGLPLVIHARAADEDMIAILREESRIGAFPAILHCFSSGAALARAGVELGFYLSFSGIITFRNSDELRAIARETPSDRLLVETDAPYLAPVPHRGKRNEPAYVAETARVLAGVHGLAPDQMAAITTANALRCFTKMPPLAAAA